MAIQYPDLIADAAGSAYEPFNISSSNDQFSVKIDGGGTQTFTLTHGSTQTAAQIVADLSGLTGAVASVVSVGAANIVRLRTSSASGNSSSIQFLTPSNNSNTVLGFVATTYYGGSYQSYFFDANTKQNIIDGVEQAMLNAGWVTISGHGTTTLKMQSSMTPAAQNLRMRVRIQDNGGNGVQFSGSNVFETYVGTSNTSATGGVTLLPVGGRRYQVIACKYQVWVVVQGQTVGNDAVFFGTPWMPSALGGVLYESFFMQGPCFADFSANNSSFRTNWGTLSSSYRANLTNGTYWESTFNPSGPGDQTLLIMQGNQRSGTLAYRWHDRSALMYDPLIAWGQRDQNDECLIRGQLWISFMCSDFYELDEQITSVDSHTWQAVSYAQPTLMMLVA